MGSAEGLNALLRCEVRHAHAKPWAWHPNRPLRYVLGTVPRGRGGSGPPNGVATWRTCAVALPRVASRGPHSLPRSGLGQRVQDAVDRRRIGVTAAGDDGQIVGRAA